MTAVVFDVPQPTFSALRKEPDEFAREIRLAAAVKWPELGLVCQQSVFGGRRRQHPGAQLPPASTRANTSASTLPPHRVVPTTWPRSCERSCMAAAKLAAPAPSARLWVSV